MLQIDAKHSIIDEWRGWASKHRTGQFNFDFPIFWGWLSGNKPHLLAFKSGADRWQVVKGWIESIRIH